MAGETPDVTQAAERLDKAITALEGRLHTLKSKADAASERPHDLFAGESRAELDAYGKALENAGREASAALGRAAQELRALLNGEG
ncbi:MAG TPA: hypothetical protein VG407_15635 [Caulobacteraceae bacterium]|jgi:hypothetical protein|nr:hypothetical protein [Caulobacteraceae bacterium]